MICPFGRAAGVSREEEAASRDFADANVLDRQRDVIHRFHLVVRVSSEDIVSHRRIAWHHRTITEVVVDEEGVVADVDAVAGEAGSKSARLTHRATHTSAKVCPPFQVTFASLRYSRLLGCHNSQKDQARPDRSCTHQKVVCAHVEEGRALVRTVGERRERDGVGRT